VKVFALKDVQVDAHADIELSKNLPFKPLTTRVLYAGKHLVELSVNGCISESHAFELVA
jgi:hypothetical protein